MKSLSKTTVYCLALFCCLIWSGAYIAGKAAVGTPEAPGFGPIRTAFFRFTISGVLLALWSLWRNPASMRIQREDWPGFFRLGLLGICLTYLFNYGGIALTTGTAAALLMATEPIWVAVLATIFLKERLSKARSVGIIAGFMGTILVILSTRPLGQALSFTGGAMLGNLLIVLSLSFEAAAVLTVKRLANRYSGQVILTYDFLIGSVLLFPFAIGETVRLGWPHPTSEAWWAFAYLLFICTFIGYTTWYRLLESNDASEITVFIFIQPVIGTLLGIFWRGDPFSAVTFIGAFFVLVGMGGILYESTRRKSRTNPIVKAEVYSTIE